MLRYLTSFSAAKVPSAGVRVLPILRGLVRSADTQRAQTADMLIFNKVHYEMCQVSSETGQAHKRSTNSYLQKRPGQKHRQSRLEQ